MAHARSITLTNEEVLYLQSLTRQRTIQAQVVDRAKMLLYKAQGASNSDIAERLDVNINTVKLCLSKFREGGVQRALFDDKRKGRPVEITDDAIAWIISIACQRPTDLGYAQELWTLKNLHQYIQNHAEEAGYSRLTTITKPMVQKILNQSEIKPFKIKYYCEKRDPDFETKMHDVLVVYKQVEMQFDENGDIIVSTDSPMIHTISCDEKPGIQAIATTSDDLRPTEGNGCVYRDYEYKRLGNLNVVPKASASCTGCGKCADACPTGAINKNNIRTGDSSKCISCMGCIAACPKGIRKLNPVFLAAASLKMKDLLSGRKPNEIFL